MTTAERTRLPNWFRRQIPSTADRTHTVLDKFKLNTVCESALCPNRSECYSRNTATFMILGDVCTRSCGFCAIKVGKPLVVEQDEPQRVAEAAAALGLKYVVITSVARDEMPDEGAGHFAKTILAVKERIPNVQIEVLTPDFHARRDCLETVVSAKPTVYNHNLETVERLQRDVRPQASYERTLEVLRLVKEIDPAMTTKSGIMLGLGETHDEVLRAARDLRNSGCDILTLGQYLSPGEGYLKIQKYFSPEEFESFADEIKPMGFKEVFAGPFVRSSYHAGETFLNATHS